MLSYDIEGVKQGSSRVLITKGSVNEYEQTPIDSTMLMVSKNQLINQPTKQPSKQSVMKGVPDYGLKSLIAIFLSSNSSDIPMTPIPVPMYITGFSFQYQPTITMEIAAC